ncbi:hypothetical protein BKP45_03350 [Anaerobacillus alkalidiazotrophicus]|uniref:Acylphosphatase n=1 Tax=Anaerobacillus alkalidiazotrophicus TaxID=472963 RepID=A0A1S2MD30_9BACI|nr:acylphosphatase [Anaerobacillus alkalidiazotrophicus]OIJ21747.1 hypothetical protein BKP45_03350 [Anaerobacillus alkalidiazotrophicus]
MEGNEKHWLPHYIDAVPIEASRKKTSMYVIALEGWRRGMTLKFYNKNEDNKLQIRYSLSHQGHEHHFQGSKGDKVTEEAYNVCDNKGLTNEYLSKAGVPIPQGKKFSAETKDSEILHYAKTLEFPLVLKPTNGCAGKGVIANIETIEELKEALVYVRKEINYPEVIVEQFVTGEEIRVYVLGDKILGAANRRPANIVGDGVNTVQQLIRKKNQERKKIPHLYFRPIKVDKEVRHSIEGAGYTLDSIPKAGKRIYLRKISNVSAGGDPIDFTNRLTDNMKNIAISAVKAVPGLVQCGVDMIIDEKRDRGVILELNTKAGIGSHIFPIEGYGRDIPKAIIDYYFPETKEMHNPDSKVFFDLKSIIDSLQRRSSIEIEVTPAPTETLFAKKFTLSGSVSRRSFHSWIKKEALSRNLHGSVNKLRNGDIDVLIAGASEAQVDTFKELLSKHFATAQIDDIAEERWQHPVKVGFEISNELTTMTLEHLEDELTMIKKEMEKVQRERKRFERRTKMIVQSRSWKMIEPLRKLFHFFKKTLAVK